MIGKTPCGMRYQKYHTWVRLSKKICSQQKFNFFACNSDSEIHYAFSITGMSMPFSMRYLAIFAAAALFAVPASLTFPGELIQRDSLNNTEPGCSLCLVSVLRLYPSINTLRWVIYENILLICYHFLKLSSIHSHLLNTKRSLLN